MPVDGPSTKHVLPSGSRNNSNSIIVDMHVRGSIFSTIIVYLISQFMWAVCFDLHGDLFVEDEPIKLACALFLHGKTFYDVVWSQFSNADE